MRSWHGVAFGAGLTITAALAGPTTALAQPRTFNCIGAEQLQDDVFAISFRGGSTKLDDAARTPMAAAARIAQDPSRLICVLGHAAREGGQTTSTRIAARRAGAVAEALATQFGIERDRIRAEARNPAFARSTPNRETRSVTIVVLPARPGEVPPPPSAIPIPARPPGGQGAPGAAPPHEPAPPGQPPRGDTPPAQRPTASPAAPSGAPAGTPPLPPGAPPTPPEAPKEPPARAPAPRGSSTPPDQLLPRVAPIPTPPPARAPSRESLPPSGPTPLPGTPLTPGGTMPAPPPNLPPTSPAPPTPLPSPSPSPLPGIAPGAPGPNGSPTPN